MNSQFFALNPKGSIGTARPVEGSKVLHIYMKQVLMKQVLFRQIRKCSHIITKHKKTLISNKKTN